MSGRSFIHSKHKQRSVPRTSQMHLEMNLPYHTRQKTLPTLESPIFGVSAKSATTSGSAQSLPHSGGPLTISTSPKQIPSFSECLGVDQVHYLGTPDVT